MDVGCGKGSAILSMLKEPFLQIDGIEISGEISKIAKNNFKKINAKNVEIFNIDASIFNQYYNYNYFYFYNPFPDKIMSLVIDLIIESSCITNREVIIIYNNPTCHDLLESKKINFLKEYQDAWGNKINTYAIKKI